ncbi:hypothetical protein D3C78_1479420 [compost metagenome]
MHDVKKTLSERHQIRIDGPHVFVVRPVLSPIGAPDRTDSPKDANTGQTGQEPDESRTGTGQSDESPKFEEF